MAVCQSCNATILFGGKKAGSLRFCNDSCLEKGQVLITAKEMDPAAVEAAAWEVHRGLCPCCGGSGPVDVHISHEVWSVLIMSSWKSIPRISCRACGVRQQLGGLLFSFLLGWWGFPWGLIVTPTQIARNLGGLISPPAPEQPSPQLLEHMRLYLAEGELSQES